MREQTIGVGVIGTGLWGAHHARVFSTLPNTRLIAVCDRSETRARMLATEHGVATVHADHRVLLETPGIDAVSIATPDFTHTPIILDALAAGKHVLSEKPLATNLEEAERIKTAAGASDRKVMVDFHNRVSPVFAAARDDIRDGQIGRPVHAAARLSNTTFVPLEMLSWSARSSALWFLGSHAVDILRFLLDDDVKRVFAMKAKGVLQGKGIDTDDVHLSMLEFGKGTIATLENSWILSPDNPQVFDFTVDLVGDAGQLQLDPSHNGAYRNLSGAGMKYRDLFGLTPVGSRRVGGFVMESIARFVDAILDDTPVLASVEDGLRVTRILTAIEDSARSGQPVDIAD